MVDLQAASIGEKFTFKVSLPRGPGWGEEELTRRISDLGREAHLSLMAVAAFALGGRRPGDIVKSSGSYFSWGTIKIAIGGKVLSGFKTIGIGASLLLLVACGGIAEDPQIEISQEPPAATAPVDGGTPPACTPGNGGLCGDQHSTCQGFSICSSSGQWGPCILPDGCK